MNNCDICGKEYYYEPIEIRNESICIDCSNKISELIKKLKRKRKQTEQKKVENE